MGEAEATEVMNGMPRGNRRPIKRLPRMALDQNGSQRSSNLKQEDDMLKVRKLGLALVVLASAAPQAAALTAEARIAGAADRQPALEMVRFRAVYYPRIAVAVDGRGHWGYAVSRNGTDPGRNALSYCHHALCRIEARGRGACLAFYESRAGGYWYGIGIGNSLRQVERIASHGCSLGAPAGTCRAVKSLCR